MEKKRKFQINKNINKYNLLRFHYLNYKEICWYNWIFYCYETPIWNKRIRKYKIKINYEKKNIEFIDENEEEEFHELYDYEFDEQSLETQNKSLIELDLPRKKKNLIDLMQELSIS